LSERMTAVCLSKGKRWWVGNYLVLDFERYREKEGGREAREEEACIYWLVRLYLEKEEKIKQLYSLLHFRKGRKEGRNGGRRSLRGAI